MPEPRIILEGVGKRYLLGEDASGRRRRSGGAREEIWSLRDVCLEVEEGLAMGVIGRNGAGKSTLLKLIGRITEPTTGVARMRGRVGSLLELGAGFHPLLTGRENIYLSGALMGLRRSEVDRRFDEMVDFAGVAPFLDTPIRRYSTGMYLRLAFAVGVHIDAEILLVDEIIAVGDAEYQRKCLHKMRTILVEGRTILFVSHDLEGVEQLCQETIWIERGRLALRGPTTDVINQYLASAEERGRRVLNLDTGLPITLQTVAVLGPVGNPAEMLARSEPFTIEVEFTVDAGASHVDLSIQLTNPQGHVVIEEALSWGDDCIARYSAGRYVARLTVPPVLRGGEYGVNVWFGVADANVIWEEGVLRFLLVGDRELQSKRMLDLGRAIELRRADDHEAGGGVKAGAG